MKPRTLFLLRGNWSRQWDIREERAHEPVFVGLVHLSVLYFLVFALGRCAFSLYVVQGEGQKLYFSVAIPLHLSGVGGMPISCFF
ncbi:cyclase family protein [Lasius niger]|uniref:Cyclase family protein n=1 Tax=Lasius niger TaxID=67767 RepID=A0A0J7MZ67_LASNI|nr:cyclase family protein [Lasius niger]